jgi:hypothetical protein
LAPFLALKGITEKQPIRPQDAIELKERCLADLKNRLIDNANLIQKRFETVRYKKRIPIYLEKNFFIEN